MQQVANNYCFTKSLLNTERFSIDANFVFQLPEHNFYSYFTKKHKSIQKNEIRKGNQ